MGISTAPVGCKRRWESCAALVLSAAGGWLLPPEKLPALSSGLGLRRSRVAQGQGNKLSAAVSTPWRHPAAKNLQDWFFHPF